MLDIFLFAFADRLLHGTENIPVLLQKFENGIPVGKTDAFPHLRRGGRDPCNVPEAACGKKPVHAFIVSGADGID